MSRPEERRAEAEPQEDRADVGQGSEPETPPIDEDVAGSVNAALHDADE
jgi:hypothetical protein